MSPQKQPIIGNRGGGQNKQTYLLNIDTFKLFCIKAGTKKTDEIHKYYVKLENLLHETIQEECRYLKSYTCYSNHYKHFNKNICNL